MSRRTFTIAFFLVATMVIAATAESACAQGGGGRRGRGGRGGWFGDFGRTTHQLQIAQLPEVETELKLTDEQKTQVADLNDEFDDARDDLGGGRGGGGRRELSPEEQAERDKLNADYAAKLNALLEEPQQKRIQEVYVQVNGISLLTDSAMATLLNITDEQKEKLTTVQDEQRQAMMDGFQELRDMPYEERQSKSAELVKARDDAMLAVLTEEQKKQFEDMKGEALAIDMSQLQRRGFGGRGGGGRGGRGRGGDDAGDDGGGAGGNRPAADEGA